MLFLYIMLKKKKKKKKKKEKRKKIECRREKAVCNSVVLLSISNLHLTLFILFDRITFSLTVR
jgi:hypothetical protein